MSEQEDLKICTKGRYKTEEEVDAKIVQLVVKSKDMVTLSRYKCPICHHFHLTSKLKGRK